MMVLRRIGFLLLAVAATHGPWLSAASAAPRELSEAELTEVTGQGLVTVDNSSLGGLNFSTITFNANVSLNANFQNIVMGQYTNASNNGSGADINIPLLQFGTSAGTTAQQTVQITDPYIQFVYNNAAGAGNSQVVGMRIGFEGISGNVGVLMSTISGSLQLADGTTGTLSSDGYRSTTACAGSTCVPLSQIGGIVAGNASGPSRDFWISLLSQPVQFPAIAGMAQSAEAQAGVWLNWTDRLTASNTTGTVQPNMLTALFHH
jgi:hypothetical protein